MYVKKSLIKRQFHFEMHFWHLEIISTIILCILYCGQQFIYRPSSFLAFHRIPILILLRNDFTILLTNLMQFNYYDVNIKRKSLFELQYTVGNTVKHLFWKVVQFRFYIIVRLIHPLVIFNIITLTEKLH